MFTECSGQSLVMSNSGETTRHSFEVRPAKRSLILAFNSLSANTPRIFAAENKTVLTQ